MTNQEKNRMLLQYRTAGREEQRLEQELAKWRARAEKATASYSQAPGGNGDGRAFENTTMHIVELQDELNSQYGHMAQLRMDIDKAIENVNDPKLRELLKLRYVEGMTWEKIAVEMNYSWRQVVRLHGQALSVLKIGGKK